MKRCLVFVLLSLLLATRAVAQSDSLQPAFHEAERLPPTAFTGTWTEVIDGGHSVMSSTTAEDSVSVSVASAGQIVIYRDMLAMGGGTAEICIDGLCATFTTISSIDQRAAPVAFEVENDESEVTIRNTDGSDLRLDALLLLVRSELAPAAPPDAARAWVTLPDGSIAAFDRTLTSGETFMIAFAVAQIALLLILIAVTAWKR